MKFMRNFIGNIGIACLLLFTFNIVGVNNSRAGTYFLSDPCDGAMVPYGQNGERLCACTPNGTWLCNASVWMIQQSCKDLVSSPSYTDSGCPNCTKIRYYIVSFTDPVGWDPDTLTGTACNWVNPICTPKTTTVYTIKSR